MLITIWHKQCISSFTDLHFFFTSHKPKLRTPWIILTFLTYFYSLQVCFLSTTDNNNMDKLSGYQSVFCAKKKKKIGRLLNSFLQFRLSTIKRSLSSSAEASPKRKVPKVQKGQLHPTTARQIPGGENLLTSSLILLHLPLDIMLHSNSAWITITLFKAQCRK